MKIAITGATGFIGQYMVRGMVNAGHSVRALCRPGREHALDLPEEGEVDVHIGDLTDKASLKNFMVDVDVLIHLASAHDHFSDDVMQKVNVRGSEYLVDEAKRTSPKARLFIISSAVIGQPVYSYYRDSKRVQEKVFRGSAMDWASFRPTLVYGKGDDRHTGKLLRRCAKKGSYWVPHRGNSKINPVHVDDVVEAIIKFFDFKRGVDCVYELAGPEGISFNEFVDLTIKAAGGKLKRRNIPRKWANRLIFLKGLVTDNSEDRRASAYFSLHHDHDITNAVYELGWKPRTYAEGIAEVAQGDWWHTAQEE
ncbi:MAG: nucleoside-diphosphate-sugar epimerase [Planctomycetota bacterium]|jgi:nucleoside-diphosphate-sugar epimerase